MEWKTIPERRATAGQGYCRWSPSSRERQEIVGLAAGTGELCRSAGANESRQPLRAEICARSSREAVSRSFLAVGRHSHASGIVRVRKLRGPDGRSAPSAAHLLGSRRMATVPPASTAFSRGDRSSGRGELRPARRAPRGGVDSV